MIPNDGYSGAVEPLGGVGQTPDFRQRLGVLGIGAFPRLSVLFVGAFPPGFDFPLQLAQAEIDRGGQTGKGNKSNG